VLARAITSRSWCDRRTDEDVIPKWLLRAFDVQRPVTFNVREESGESQLVARRRSPKVILQGGLCNECNNERLSRVDGTNRGLGSM